MGRSVRLDRSGITLLAVLLGLAMVSAVAATVIAVGVIEYQTSRDYLAATKARLVADAGIAHTTAVIGGPLASRSFDKILVGADGVGTGNGTSCGTADTGTDSDPLGNGTGYDFTAANTSTTDMQCTIPDGASPNDTNVYNCAILEEECRQLARDSDEYNSLGCSQFETQTDLSYGWKCIDDPGDDGVLAGFPELDASEEIVQQGVDYHDGTYQVRLVNDIGDPSGNPFVDSNFRVVAVARGQSDAGGEAQVKVMFEAPPYPAVTVNGDLWLTAQPKITGACAGAHANGEMLVANQVRVDGPISADTVIHWYYNQADLDKIEQDAPPLEVPRLNPLDYCPDADYILRNGWKINVTATPDSVQLGGNSDWSYHAANNAYKLGGHTSDLGTFCVHGNVSYTASMGTEGEPVPITLIATGTVSLAGRSRISPAHPDGLLIVAGGDIYVGGQAGARYSGLIYTENQCDFGGSATVEALIMCYDAPDSWTPEIPDLGDFNQVAGSTTVSYDCNGLRQRPRVTAWWE